MHFSQLGHSGAEWLCLCIYSLSLLLLLLTSALGIPWYVVGGMESSLNGGRWGGWEYTWKRGEETPEHMGGQLSGGSAQGSVAGGKHPWSPKLRKHSDLNQDN